MNEIQTGYVPNEVYKVEQFGNTFKLIDTQGVKVGTLGATTGVRKGAFNEGKAVQAYINKNGKKTFRKVDMDCQDIVHSLCDSSCGNALSKPDQIYYTDLDLHHDP